jgi:ABC-type polysaccharide/polyol phosphate export permease
MTTNMHGELIPPVAYVKRRYSIASILGELWDSRDLVMQFIQRDLTVRYVQAVMGFAWALLMPILIVCAGLVFRLVVSTLSGRPLEGASIASLAVKALPWAFFSGALNSATQSIIGNANLIGKIFFPRESLPIATVLAQCTDLLVGVVAVGVILPVIGIGLPLTSFWSVAVLLLLIVFTTGCALILSCANLFYRDVKYIMQVVLNFGVFATPVFFEPQMLGPKGAGIMLTLPLSPFIQAMDMAIVRGHSLLSPLTVDSAKGPIEIWAPWMLGYAAVTSVLIFCLGLLIFRGASARFAEMA